MTRALHEDAEVSAKDKWISSTKSLAVALLLNLFKNGYPCLYSYDQLFLNLRWSKDKRGEVVFNNWQDAGEAV